MTYHETAKDDRLERGREILKQIGGPGYDGPTNRLAETSPDLAAFTIAYPYGDVLSRPGPDLRRRQLCTVSTLIALGSVQPQLRFHMGELLNVGGSLQDLVEVPVLSTAILGFPAAIDSIGILRAILRDRGPEYTSAAANEADALDRHSRGMASLTALLGESEDSYTAAFRQVSLHLAQLAIDFAFGDVLSRDGLDASAKQLVVITMLATVGNRPSCPGNGQNTRNPGCSTHPRTGLITLPRHLTRSRSRPRYRPVAWLNGCLVLCQPSIAG